jgi:hypothetical protein
MTSVTLKLSELVPAYKNLIPAQFKAARRGALRGALRAVSTLIIATGKAGSANPGHKGEGGAVNTGHYKRSWKAEATPEGARVYNTAPYAGVIEHGRRPGSSFPPLKLIERWAQRRLGLTPKEAKAAAFPIARAIAKRGLAGRKVMTNALPKVEKDFIEEVEKELKAELAKGGKP